MTPPHAHIRRIAVGGFSLIELIVIMVLMGILAVSVVPKISSSSALRAQAWHDQALSALRTARSMALSHRRVVCVQFSGNSVRLQIATTHPPTACDTPVPGPDGQAIQARLTDASVTTTVVRQGTTYTGELYFQPEGRVTLDLAGDTPAQWLITISGAPNIEIDGFTGHAL